MSIYIAKEINAKMTYVEMTMSSSNDYHVTLKICANATTCNNELSEHFAVATYLRSRVTGKDPLAY